MEIEFTSVKEMLTKLKEDLIDAKARINERQKEIDNDLNDCERALKALEKQEAEAPKTNGRLPKKGDKLISIASKHFDKDEEVDVIHVDDDYFDVICEDSTICKAIYISSLHKIFRFKDETPTAEDLSNLHSFQHVNRAEDKLFTHMSTEHDVVLVGSELDEIRGIVQNENNEPKKKPYRIKTREEMIAGGVVSSATIWEKEPGEGIGFPYTMYYLHGATLDHNKKQVVDSWNIEPWMITENN